MAKGHPRAAALLLVALSVACAGPAPSLTPTPTPSPTSLVASAAPTAAASASVSATPAATATPSPSAGSPTSSAGSSPSPGSEVSGTPDELLLDLTVSAPQPAGYERQLFRLWIDADGNGCDTRHEVLISESVTPVTVGARCALIGGTWISAYDGVTTTNASTFDIDHVVPLEEAWASGAYGWDPARRESYANDLGDPRTLRAVSATSNRSKGDRDPAQWMPPLQTFWCDYLDDWLVIKVRWDLTVDLSEETAITAFLQTCPATELQAERE